MDGTPLESQTTLGHRQALVVLSVNTDSESSRDPAASPRGEAPHRISSTLTPGLSHAQ